MVSIYITLFVACWTLDIKKSYLLFQCTSYLAAIRVCPWNWEVIKICQYLIILLRFSLVFNLIMSCIFNKLTLKIGLVKKRCERLNTSKWHQKGICYHISFLRSQFNRNDSIKPFRLCGSRPRKPTEPTNPAHGPGQPRYSYLFMPIRPTEANLSNTLFVRL